MQVTDEMVEAAWEAYDNAPGYFTNSELMRADLMIAVGMLMALSPKEPKQ